MPLTSRHKQILALLARGMTNKQIAGELGDITPLTVATHLKQIRDRLGLHGEARTRAGIVGRCLGQ